MVLQLSDAVIGNSFTTGLAYALFFDKPVYIYQQSVEWRNNNSGNNFTQLKHRYDIQKQFYELCADRNFTNLEAQKSWGNYYFGFDEVKSKDEMKQLLNTLIRKQ